MRKQSSISPLGCIRGNMGYRARFDANTSALTGCTGEAVNSVHTPHLRFPLDHWLGMNGRV
jgi:hypothetical protein